MLNHRYGSLSVKYHLSRISVPTSLEVWQFLLKLDISPWCRRWHSSIPVQTVQIRHRCRSSRCPKNQTILTMKFSTSSASTYASIDVVREQLQHPPSVCCCLLSVRWSMENLAVFTSVRFEIAINKIRQLMKFWRILIYEYVLCTVCTMCFQTSTLC